MKGTETQQNGFNMKKLPFDEEYFYGRVYDNYDKFQDYAEMAKDLIEEYKFFRSFLDIGCGLGNLVKEVKKQAEELHREELDIMGIDISKYAVKKANVPFIIQMDCSEKLDFKSNRFDVVHIMTTFSYLHNREKVMTALKEAYRVAKKVIIFDDVYSEKMPDSDFDPHRKFIMKKRAWLYYWSRVINHKKDKIYYYDDEIIIEKNGKNWKTK
jgi:ubiquinone/menaquinone biosynthesis C-methylase UbiE